MGCHKNEPFMVGTSPLESCFSFFNSKLRMLASKLRTLLVPSSWEQLHKKLTSVQKDCFLKLIRCISKDFSCDGEAQLKVAVLPFLRVEDQCFKKATSQDNNFFVCRMIVFSVNFLYFCFRHFTFVIGLYDCAGLS